ncbi:MAG TPA: hypothetical protein VJ140_00125 [Actinomycetota bacterium]|nr:hypothetical protein [Actinomycetota bacterium]
MQAITVIPMQAGVPVSSPGRRLTIDAGAVNRELVLDDGGILGTVNANLRHDQAAATALAKTDQPWLGRLITWRSPRPLAGGPATAARRRIAASRKTGWRLAVMTPRRCRTILGTVPRCATERGHEIHGDHGAADRQQGCGSAR